MARSTGYTVLVPGPFWRRWWHMVKPPAALPAGLVPPGPPPWAGPSDSELGVAVPLRLVLTKQPGLVIALTDCVAYSNGFNFGIALRARADLDHLPLGFGPPSDGDREGTFEVGVRFADGRKATTSGAGPNSALMAYYQAWREGREPDVPAGPSIGHSSGGGGGKRWDFHYWVWPLPPDGPLTITCEWRASDMALSSSDVDGGAIRRAGKASTSLWD